MQQKGIHTYYMNDASSYNLLPKIAAPLLHAQHPHT
jgi:predicted alpha/beta-fold hydrolase